MYFKVTKFDFATTSLLQKVHNAYLVRWDASQKLHLQLPEQGT